MSKKLVPPHGGQLKPLILDGEELEEERKRANTLPIIRLTSRETSDLIMMAIGAFSPLEGFMGKEDYEGVVENMHMVDGTLWPIPITLAVTEEQADSLPINSDIALVDAIASGECYGQPNQQRQ